MRRSEAEGSRAGEAERTSEAKWPQGAACEDKADAQQATRLKAARHFPQISKHPRRHCGVGEEVKYIVPLILNPSTPSRIY